MNSPLMFQLKNRKKTIALSGS